MESALKPLLGFVARDISVAMYEGHADPTYLAKVALDAVYNNFAKMDGQWVKLEQPPEYRDAEPWRKSAGSYSINFHRDCVCSFTRCALHGSKPTGAPQIYVIKP